MFRDETYTGGEHYMIVYQYTNGIHAVKRETPDYEKENETVYVGTYEQCIEYLNYLKIVNADYDLNL